MAIKFVDQLPTTGGKGRPRDEETDLLAQTLRDHPGQWALVEEDVKAYRSQGMRDKLQRRGSGFEVKYRNGSVYARYIG